MRRIIGRNKISKPRGWRSSDESGAVIVMVALSMVMLFGFLAIVVDFGRVYTERRELQNGADAAALAVAQDCASDACGGGYDPYIIAETYADANASDDLAWVDDVTVDLGAQTVRVHTATEDPGGDHHFDMTFAQLIGYDGLTVDAEATVAWGAPEAVATLPLIFSICEWEEFTSGKTLHPKSAYEEGLLPDGTSFPPTYARWEDYTTFFFLNGPPPDPIPAGYERCYQTSSDDPPPPSSFDFPGGFGWLDGGDDCSATVLDGNWVKAKNGAAVTNGCSATDMNDLIGTVQLIPYFDEIDRPNYHIAGYGALYITGFRFTGGSGGSLDGSSLITGGRACDPPMTCLEGYLIGGWIVDGPPGPGSDLGVVSIGFVK